MKSIIKATLVVSFINYIQSCFGLNKTICLNSEVNLNKDRIRCCYISYKEKKGDKAELSECSKLDYIGEEIYAYHRKLKQEYQYIDIDCNSNFFNQKIGALINAVALMILMIL